MTGKLPLIFPFQSLPPLPVSGPSCPCYPAHLPPLPSQSFSPHSTSQRCPPLSVLRCICSPLLTSVISSCHLTLRSFVPRSSPGPSRPSVCCLVHLAPCYSPFLDIPVCLSLLLIFISSPMCSSPNQNSNHPQSDLEMQLYLATWYTLFSAFIIGRL